jgi:hypothetical protein
LGVGTVVVVPVGRVVEVAWAPPAVVELPDVVEPVVVVARVVAVVVVATVVVVVPVVVVAPVAVVGGTGLAATLTVEPRSTSTVPGATDGLTCIMTAPERYFITYRASAMSLGW